MNKYFESYSKHREDKANGKRKPLRTIEEMAQELGMNKMQLSALIANHDGPKMIMRNGGKSGHKNTWYDPDDVRSWFKKYMSTPDLCCSACGENKSKSEFYALNEFVFRQPCKKCTVEKSSDSRRKRNQLKRAT